MIKAIALYHSAFVTHKAIQSAKTFLSTGQILIYARRTTCKTFRSDAHADVIGCLDWLDERVARGCNRDTYRVVTVGGDNCYPKLS